MYFEKEHFQICLEYVIRLHSGNGFLFTLLAIIKQTLYYGIPFANAQILKVSYIE